MVREPTFVMMPVLNLGFERAVRPLIERDLYWIPETIIYQAKMNTEL
ncbi:hypothetical protein POX_d05340 [Penicillium oxalicum]|nr:hypothetical protein POX_d05340 [Penicillium oxalicum]KAI2789842.1 hypothetical protein POX_d05340 [Penicillium oxalicum]